MSIIIPAALSYIKVSRDVSIHCIHSSFFHSTSSDDPSLNSTILAKHQPPHYTQVYENNSMQSSPPVSHQVYYKSEPQYGWPGPLDYNVRNFLFSLKKKI